MSYGTSQSLLQAPFRSVAQQVMERLRTIRNSDENDYLGPQRFPATVTCGMCKWNEALAL